MTSTDHTALAALLAVHDLAQATPQVESATLLAIVLLIITAVWLALGGAK